MKNAELKVVLFDENDVIATSGEPVYTLSGLKDGTTGNISFNGLNGTVTKDSVAFLSLYGNDYFVCGKHDWPGTYLYNVKYDYEERDSRAEFNGNYIYSNGKYIHQ